MKAHRILSTPLFLTKAEKPIPRFMQKSLIASAFLAFLLLVRLESSGQKGKADVWLTTADRSALFQKQDAVNFGAVDTRYQTIAVDESTKFQRMDGFGFALTGGSADHLIRMSAPARKALLQRLFDTTGTAIGISYLRLSIGASDLNASTLR